MKKLIAAATPYAISIRQKLHQIPELKYEEFKTATLIEKILESYGYQVQSGVGKTGLVAILDSGKSGKTVSLRADMDALPIEEPKENKYCSQHPGKMHACGHDGHCATVLLCAKVLSELKDEFTGKIKFIFQPAEEGGKGALAMIEDGVLDNPKVDAIFGYHNWPGLPLGQLGVKEGVILAGNGRFEITITGKVAHTAQPENAINPVTVGAELITKLDIVRKKISSPDCIINPYAFNSGDWTKGMSTQVHLVGLYYIGSAEALHNIKTEIQNLCDDIATSTHTKIKLDFTEFLSPTINTAFETKLMTSAAKKHLEELKITELSSCLIASEDFSEYLKKVPGCFFMVGLGEDAAPVHTREYQYNDIILPISATLLCQTIIDYLNNSVVLNNYTGK